MHYHGTLTPALSRPTGEGARRAGEGQCVVYPTVCSVGARGAAGKCSHANRLIKVFHVAPSGAIADAQVREMTSCLLAVKAGRTTKAGRT